jgi:aminopeptidase-like protein
LALAAEIYPIGPSITGDGVRITLDHLARHIDLEIEEVPIGTWVSDGTVPRDWTIHDASSKNPAEGRILDFVLNYSQPSV